MTGAGRELLHKGFSALQPGKISKASRSALRGRNKVLIRFIPHRTTRLLPSRATSRRLSCCKVVAGSGPCFVNNIERRFCSSPETSEPGGGYHLPDARFPRLYAQA